jgi:hypothetical protein
VTQPARGRRQRSLPDALGDPEPRIRIRPERIVGWGLDDDGRDARDARDALSV